MCCLYVNIHHKKTDGVQSPGQMFCVYRKCTINMISPTPLGSWKGSRVRLKNSGHTSTRLTTTIESYTWNTSHATPSRNTSGHHRQLAMVFGALNKFVQRLRELGV
ncbi:FirrV-1-C9 [Feldmannia irregularis virus a]|uniref:FirrV-1-C9 n=1 Tax=Feldmannia irregularis virus a TaxID=231992 RepID=Q6XLW9_9PHYC|nr:FirrV-1-C9 [Feldmannia irregularis virus a]AAR26942.1 FirrV-1-C9 [Feldmannia irregularis virus a]